MGPKIDERIIQKCFDELLSLYHKAIDLEKEYAKELQCIPDAYKLSATNLIHYLAIRRCDIRDLQIQLSYMGLSSLGRLEAHVMAGLKSVLYALNCMSEIRLERDDDFFRYVHFKQGDDLLREHTEILFGPRPFNRNVRIMVTLPSEAADNGGLIRALIKAGMNVARINSAHDGPESWLKMVSLVRETSKELNRPCRILFDLEGPKLRTGAVGTYSKVIQIKPKFNKSGHIIAPAYLVLYPDNRKYAHGKGYLPVPVTEAFVSWLSPGDIIRFKDTRGRSRKLRVILRDGEHVTAECEKPAFIEKGIELNLIRNNQIIGKGNIGDIYSQDPSITLKEGDLLKLTWPDIPGRKEHRDEQGKVVIPANMPCTLPEVFGQVKVHEKIFFDDGKIGGFIEEVSDQGLVVRIKRTHKKGGTKLRSDKGINLPDTDLRIPALSEGDLQNLDFAAKHVDLIGLSFVKEPIDVELLQKEITRRTDRELGIILKIETRTAFEHLTHLLLAGLKKPPVGVMVARGDLGVEVGFERMSEVQEQILWLCEAAHVPVIWATQVLDQMNKTGLPTRGEVTDAAMSSRAECVMLNKGPYTVETVKFLDDILVRMMDHNNKKTPMLRKLKISEGRWPSTGLGNE